MSPSIGIIMTFPFSKVTSIEFSVHNRFFAGLVTTMLLRFLEKSSSSRFWKIKIYVSRERGGYRPCGQKSNGSRPKVLTWVGPPPGLENFPPKSQISQFFAFPSKKNIIGLG